jgi:hypothetical protein
LRVVFAMAEGRLGADLAVSRLGPFHGDGEGYARVYLWGMAIQGLMLLVLPWIFVGIGLRYHDRNLHRALPMLYFKLGVLDLLGVLVAFSFWTLWKQLSAKIAEGGAEAKFLDRIRALLGSLMGGMVTLLFVAVIFLSLGLLPTGK